MKHFLAYGNSDQVSFRDREVCDAFHYMTVPGTIAAYYEEATAAFVLSAEIDYVIDPRSPLFQDRLTNARASHYSLGAWHGASVSHRLEEGRAAGVALFPPAFYDEEVLRDMTHSVIGHQRQYAERAGTVTKKLNRYRRLRAQAQQRDPEDVARSVRSPSFVLTPYFAARSLEGDPWWGLTRTIWQRALELDEPSSISPVICVASPRLLADALRAVPEGMSPTRFFWITDFDERRVTVEDLRDVYTAVQSTAHGVNLVNLYGGFFSICLGKAGLWGFSNGLGYSESRAWPELTSTGAAPARYYMRELHMYTSPAVAQSLVDADPAFACPCSACDAARAHGGSIVGMGYHLLKRHFALARRWENELVDRSSLSEIVTHLRGSEERFRTIAAMLPRANRPSVMHLSNWARALAEA